MITGPGNTNAGSRMPWYVPRLGPKAGRYHPVPGARPTASEPSVPRNLSRLNRPGLRRPQVCAP